MSEPTVIDWNGTDLPTALTTLPPGRYRIERVEGPADEPGDTLDASTPDRPDPSGPGDAPSPDGPGE